MHKSEKKTAANIRALDGLGRNKPARWTFGKEAGLRQTNAAGRLTPDPPGGPAHPPSQHLAQAAKQQGKGVHQLVGAVVGDLEEGALRGEEDAGGCEVGEGDGLEGATASAWRRCSCG